MMQNLKADLYSWGLIADKDYLLYKNRMVGLLVWRLYEGRRRIRKLLLGKLGKLIWYFHADLRIRWFIGFFLAFVVHRLNEISHFCGLDIRTYFFFPAILYILSCVKSVYFGVITYATLRCACNCDRTTVGSKVIF